jgi:hypothetical protein
MDRRLSTPTKLVSLTALASGLYQLEDGTLLIRRVGTGPNGRWFITREGDTTPLTIMGRTEFHTLYSARAALTQLRREHHGKT